jgi:hypothetical protein
VTALRVREAVQVDGLLDEPVWSLAEAASGFRQREPKEGEAATEATEVSVLYDDTNLYVGVRALDRRPRDVIARILQRDRVLQAGIDNQARWAGDDGVAILLDPFLDHRNAFLFATNPNGAEFDALVTDESASYNADWRGVWRVAARRTAQGWSAEFAIPFRSLRYPSNGGSQPWGFNVERLIRRKSEQTLWSGWSRAEGGLHRVSRAGHLVGLASLPRSRLNLEVKPYGLVGASRERQDDGSVPRDTSASLGGDLKWEVRSGLVLDGTVNPDFAQVEADDQIVNLTRFDLFLPEKREFFLENAGVFEFGTRGFFEPPPFLLFFSRQIGIKEDEGEVPVMGGVRLSGRAGRQTVGFLGILQDQAFGDPRTSFGALRVKRDVGANGFVGAMLTDRRTREGGETDGGVDFSLWPTRRLNVTGFAALTSAAGDRERDKAYRLAAEYRTGRFFLQGQHLLVGPDAETGMGFVTRTDIRRSDAFGTWTFRPGRLSMEKRSGCPTRTDPICQDGTFTVSSRMRGSMIRNMIFGDPISPTMSPTFTPRYATMPSIGDRMSVLETRVRVCCRSSSAALNWARAPVTRAAVASFSVKPSSRLCWVASPCSLSFCRRSYSRSARFAATSAWRTFALAISTAALAFCCRISISRESILARGIPFRTRTHSFT